MIQELLGGGATSLLGGDHRKISNNINSCGGILQGPITSTTSTPTTTTTITTTNTTTTSSATTTNATTPNTSEQQNLRCPRCDSSNTKFCYYNNYNLTQPRHFCKTCRRYWTKGGALRNVPIGGGCRKNKSTTSSSVTSAKVGGATGMKVKSGSTDIIKSSTLGFEHEQSPNPILWASPHNSHLLALLRATTQNPNPNPNPNPNSVIIKEEGSLLASTINGSSHLNSSNSSSSEAAVMALNARPNIISSSDLPIGLCSTSWRNLNLNNHHHHHHQQQVQYHHQQQQQQQQQQQYHHGLLSTSEVQNSSSSGLHELYQRLRSASSNYQTDHHHHHHQSPTFLTNNSFCSSSPSTALDPSPISGADHLAGYWNPAFSSSAAWSNLSTTNGAFP